MLGNFRHPHLVPLLAFCISSEDIEPFVALIYPRMSSSLEDALHLQHADALLASVRLSIALDAASGLAYLHSSGDKPVILHMAAEVEQLIVQVQRGVGD